MRKHIEGHDLIVARFLSFVEKKTEKRYCFFRSVKSYAHGHCDLPSLLPVYARGYHLSRIHDLPRIQLIIFPFLLDQFLMAAPLDDPSLFQDHDAVAVSYRG